MTLYELIEQVKPETPVWECLKSITIPQLLELEEDEEDWYTGFFYEETEGKRVLEKLIWKLGEYSFKFAEVLQEEIPKVDWGSLDISKFRFFAYCEEDSRPALNLRKPIELHVKLLLNIFYNTVAWTSKDWVDSCNGALLRELMHTHPEYHIHKHLDEHVRLLNTMSEIMKGVEI